MSDTGVTVFPLFYKEESIEEAGSSDRDREGAQADAASVPERRIIGKSRHTCREAQVWELSHALQDTGADTEPSFVYSDVLRYPVQRDHYAVLPWDVPAPAEL